MVVTEENQGYQATLGNCGADPYFCSLASAYTSATSWFAVAHPSLPNYLAFDSGSTQGCGSDTCTGPYGATDLGGQLNAAGLPWVAYMESMPSRCYTGTSYGYYAKKHNPFIFFSDVLSSASCGQVEQPYAGASNLVANLDSSKAPAFVWISPNELDDMHSGSVQQGDQWLQANIAPVLSSSWFTNFNSTLIITMDENDSQPAGGCCGGAAGGQVPMVVISHQALGHGSIGITGDHYGLLRTIEETYGFRLLGAASDSRSGDLSSYFCQK